MHVREAVNFGEEVEIFMVNLPAPSSHGCLCRILMENLLYACVYVRLIHTQSVKNSPRL